MGRLGLRMADLFGKRDDLCQVGLVVHRLLLALRDQSIEELGHLLVVLGVNGGLVDNQPADVVLDCFRHRLAVFAQAPGKRVHGRLAPLHDQLHQRQVVEARELLAFFGPDVSV